jgi:tight adherence protein B
MHLVIPLLFAACIAGFAWILAKALESGLQVYSGAYSRDMARQFDDIFLFIPPQRIAELGWAAAAVMFILFFMLTGSLTSVGGVLSGLFFGCLVGGIALRAPHHVLLLLKKRRLTRFNMQLGDTLVGMSNALKAGFSILQAFETVVNDGENPIAQEFDMFLQETRVGVSFSDALNHLDQRMGSEDLTLVVNAIETARRTGGNLTEIFEKISETIRARMRIENRIQTLTAQGRLQGVVVGVMPVIITIALMLLDPGMMIPFFHSTVGIGVVIAVVALIGFGALMIRKIVNIQV